MKRTLLSGNSALGCSTGRPSAAGAGASDGRNNRRLLIWSLLNVSSGWHIATADGPIMAIVSSGRLGSGCVLKPLGFRNVARRRRAARPTLRISYSPEGATSSTPTWGHCEAKACLSPAPEGWRRLARWAGRRPGRRRLRAAGWFHMTEGAARAGAGLRAARLPASRL